MLLPGVLSNFVFQGGEGIQKEGPQIPGADFCALVLALFN